MSPLDATSARLCAAVAGWRYEDLTGDVVGTIKRFIMDTLGVIGGAARAPGIEALHARARHWEHDGSATALLGHRSCSPPTAALLNGAAAHALDYDDLHDGARVHTNCVVLPAVLATAQDVGGVSGRDFILAMAVGTEIHARLGLACPGSLARGWHPTTVLGTLAAALAAGIVRKLDATALNHALGIGFHQTCGTAQSIRDGALSKRVGAGFASRNAVWAAALAADGVSGPHRALEGDAGLFTLYERGETQQACLFAALGEDWRVTEYSIKPYPCCRCMHTVIGIGIDLHRQGVHADDVARAEVRMGEVNVQTVGGAYDAARASVVHAQFSAAYGFARALIDGRAGLSAFQQPAIADARVAAMADRVRVVADDAIQANAIEPARVRLTLRDGRIIDTGCDTMKGSPQAPLSDTEFEVKFDECMTYGLAASEAAIARLASAIRELQDAPDAAHALVSAFPAPVAPPHGSVQ